MARRIPVRLVVVSTFWAGKKRLLEDTRVTRLVESRDTQLLIRVLFNDAKGVFVSVERGHENKGHIDAVCGVEMFDLADSQIEESHLILDFESALRTGHAHGSTETTIDLEDCELVEDLRV